MDERSEAEGGEEGGQYKGADKPPVEGLGYLKL